MMSLYWNNFMMVFGLVTYGVVFLDLVLVAIALLKYIKKKK